MSLRELLKTKTEHSLSSLKWQRLRGAIIRHLLSNGNSTINELGAEMQSSTPTITKALNELQAEGFIVDLGKIENNGGRRPAMFSLVADSGYCMGIEVNRNSLSMGIQNLKDEFINLNLQVPFILENNIDSLTELCTLINQFIEDSGVDVNRIVGACINLSGRINSREGFSYNYFFTENRPLSEIISDQIHLPVFIENDSRAMALGEYCQGVVENERNVIFLNYSWGVGIGVISEGNLYYGKSGYSGEFGHSPLFDNDIMCQCGRLGCLETEISGWALQQQFTQAVAEGRKTLVNLENIPIPLQHLKLIAGAADQEDNLCIELISKQSEQMGRYVSILINIFNPDLVVLGGDFARLGDFVLLPMQTALRKHSLGLVNQDMKFKRSTLGVKAGVIGACCVVKQKMIENKG